MGGAADFTGAVGASPMGAAAGPRRGLLQVTARIDLVEFPSKTSPPEAKPST
jgi:hypothetical protein